MAALTVLAAWYDLMLVERMWQLHMNDFGRFYYSARCLLDGCDAYAPNPATLVPVPSAEARHFLNMNPPHFHVLVLPLALCPPAVALALWSVLSLTSLVLAGRLVVRETGPVRFTLPQGALLALAALAFVGTGTQLVTGQVAWLLAWPVALLWRDYRRGNWLRAGLELGLLSGIKPFLVLLFVLFLPRGKRSGLVSGIATIVAAFLVGTLAFGWESHVSWLRSLESADWPWAAMNGSLLAIVTRTFSPTPTSHPLAARPDFVRGTWFVASVLVGTASYFSLQRNRDDPDRAFLAWLVAALLISPLGWIYYSWFALPPLVALARRGFLARRRLLLLPAWVAAFWPLWAFGLCPPSPWATVTLRSVYSWGFLAVWVAVLRDSLAFPEATEEGEGSTGEAGPAQAAEAHRSTR